MKRFVPLFFLLLFAAGSLLSLGNREKKRVKPQYSEPQKIEASGIVRLVGSSPLTSLVISGEDREWYVEAGEKEKLMHLQQQNVTVIAYEYYEDRVFANGTSAGRYYFLKDIIVINPRS
ncbi:MAG: hypothetical protein LBU85_00935 [Treponema sp.]|nr:hypothetical protein [Treponema sp.]